MGLREGREPLPTTGKANIVLVDDDAGLRDTLAQLLRDRGYAVQTYGSAQDFLNDPPPPRPACLLLDIFLPDGNGLDILNALCPEYKLPIILITGSGDISMAVKAMKAGALDFLTKPLKIGAIIDAVDRALAHSRREEEQDAQEQVFEKRLASLSPREYEVFCGVTAGQLNKQIALDLGISEKTVKVHRGRMMRKMEVDSVAELVRIAVRLGVEAE